MKIAVVGSRDFPRLAEVRAFVAGLPRDTVIVSGGARGVDTAAVDEARVRGMRYIVLPADWKTWGKRAGFMRNADIVEAADRIVAFWDGVSRGTPHTVRLAEAAGKPVEVRR